MRDVLLTLPYSKDFGSKKAWRIGTQNNFAGENLGRLSIHIKGIKVKQKSWWIRLWPINHQSLNSPRLFTVKVFFTIRYKYDVRSTIGTKAIFNHTSIKL